MDSGFVFSFLNARVAAEYWPRIAEGFALTLALAALIVVAGLLAGLVLAAVRALGIEETSKLAQRLLAEGAPGIHFYTLNRSKATREVWHNLVPVAPAV